MADILTLSGLSAAYHGIQALHGVDLSVQEHGITAVIGPNGAGKSTTLNFISGLVRPREGSIVFQGDVIGGRKADAISRMGVLQVPEGRRVLGPLSVQENLLLGRLALGRRRADDIYSLDTVFELFPILRAKRAQLAHSLSGGQQQMLAIGRALMGGPRLLMLDEPSLGLAPLVVDEVFAALSRLNQNGLALLLIEQNAGRALQVSTYAYVLDQGAIVRHGPSAELASDPAIVEHYLGTASAGAAVPTTPQTGRCP